MEILELIQANLLTPIILFFLFGIIAARIKSDLKIPEAISEFLPSNGMVNTDVPIVNITNSTDP